MIVSRKMSTRSMQNHREIQNKDSEATVYLYGEIGGWFGIDSQEFVKEFNAIDASTIHLRIDSGGGDVFAARAMKTAIMQHKAKVIAHIDGLAASAASFLAMGADEIEIVDGGFLMIHNALSLLDILGYFNIDDISNLMTELDKERGLHEKINESIANDYMKKSGASQSQIMDWMSSETWFTAKEALENNLVDRVYDGNPVQGNYDLSVFAKVPETLAARNHRDSKRAFEKALREAGCSVNQAKAILAKGYSEELREAEPTEISTAEPLREAEPVTPVTAKDRTAELLIKAEEVAPTQRAA